MKVEIGVSNKHVHLSKEDLQILFGENYELEIKKELKQSGEYASTQTVTLRTEKGEIPAVRILGPTRNYTQVEISKTDAFRLGLNPPVRDSGDLAGSEKVTIVGPNGIIENKESCIIATRHIHLNYEKLSELGLKETDKVSVKVYGIKGGILENVSLKVGKNYTFEMHIDTDDANAHLINQNDIGEILV